MGSRTARVAGVPTDKRPLGLFLFCFTIACCSVAHADAGSRADRAALFDYILQKTFERESFSPIKNEKLGLDVRKEMEALRDEFLAADTDDKLYYALVKLSNARKDRHLSVELIPGGLVSDWVTEAPPGYPVSGDSTPRAPVKVYPDYGARGPSFFVRDRAQASTANTPLPEPGERILGVNGMAIEDYVRRVEPYYRYSTREGFYWHLARLLPQRSPVLPESHYSDTLTLELEKESGERYQVDLEYADPETIDWLGIGERRFPGFDLSFSAPTFDLYQHFEKPVLLIVWHGFREHLVEDVNRLMDYASQRGLLNHALIFDGTRSRGGSKGAYAIQRLTSKPFKTSFGNLKLSDVTQAFIDRKVQEWKARSVLDSGVSETMDDGRWLVDWLQDDVQQGLQAGQSYSNDVPFKLAHLPKYSDGFVRPAKEHFRGPLVCLFGPYGGSHLDQFASIVIDNDLAHTLGMSAGGYSNTWEWEEDLKFPTNGRPVAKFMWSIGHTVRPNGQILEGNPARVHEYLPLTRDNFRTYHAELLELAYKHLESVR